jgi:small subunit ribosomal protein S16
VVDGRATRDGRVIEELGYYDPSQENPDHRFSVKADRVQYWLSKGAQPSDTVRTLLKQAQKAEAAAK